MTSWSFVLTMVAAGTRSSSGGSLATNRTDSNILHPDTVLGVWDVDGSAFTFGPGSATLTFRYDHVLAQAKGLTEADLKVWRYSGGWVHRTGSVDADLKTITTQPLNSFFTMAVSTEIPGDAPPAGTLFCIR